MSEGTHRVTAGRAQALFLASLAVLLCLAVSLQLGTQAAAQAPAPAKPMEAKKEAGAAKKRVTNLRDPFRSPVSRNEEGMAGQALPPGKRGLVIAQLSVDGIIITPSDKIAVVNMRGRNRAYFLRERDEVWNGFVARITEDGVVFRERATDAFGSQFEREVTKQLTGSGAKP